MAKQSHEVAADWRELNPDTLPDDIRLAYDLYKEAQREAAKQRDGFESMLTKAINPPSGQRLAFGYRFGKLSIAVVPDERKPTVSQQSLADFMRSASLNGSRI